MLKDGEVLENFFGDKKIIQNVNLYRFTSDSILLSKFATAKSGDRVADFCSGSGVVGFHFLCLNPKIDSLILFEMQEELAEMSSRTADINGFACKVENCKIQDIAESYNDYFSLVLCNPPYERGGFDNKDYKKAVCRKEIELTLKDVGAAAYKALKFGGRLCIVNRADRVAELIYTLKECKLETKKLQFVSGASGAKPYLVMAEAVKGGKPETLLLPTVINNDN